MVIAVEVKGEITEATAEMVNNALNYAEKIDARLILILLDTPGGSVASVKDIMVKMETSDIPVAVLVYPVGATAWSGGTYILMASHIAAMASGTTVGSAQPVTLTPAGPIYVNESKTINALTGLIVHHARLHSRNTTAARLFVEKNLNLGAAEAKKYHIIEFIADDPHALLQQLETKALIKIEESGEDVWKIVDILNASKYSPEKTITFNGISSAKIVYYKPGPRIFILQLLTNPLIAEILLVMGMLLLFVGIKTPGYGAETAGALMLAAAAIGLNVIGVDIGGLFFIIIGFILLIFELKTHVGVLAILGSISVVIGSLMLVPSANLWLTEQEFRKIWLSVLIISAILIALFAFLIFKVAQAQRRKPKVGPEALIGAEGIAITDIDPEGEVRVEGEIWRARSATEHIRRGEKVKIKRREGLTLIVEKITGENKSI